MSASDDLVYQKRILPRVSRTFALTIPQLPFELENVVANAYLLCRLADTIEDDPDLGSSDKSDFMDEFLSAIQGNADPERFARRLAPRLSEEIGEAERDLVIHTPVVLRIFDTFSDSQRRAVVRCVTTMCKGMPEFQRDKTLAGLPSMVDLDRYCYFVAGIVGEMLTDLFCAHCTELAEQQDEMIALAVCFGQGLQMTNILKDIWEDRESSTCWLPRSVFSDIDGGLAQAMQNGDGQAMAEGIAELVGIAHAHLQSALEYTLRIPKQETGIRRFCLWAIGMALLTLKRINDHPGYSKGSDVKISRRAVKATIATCNIAQSSDRLLKILFRIASHDLPLADDGNICPPPGARLASDRL